ncbi:MAG TPA: chemotaxis response regulator protein-glutamate methylesterase [Terriglobales bacterium]|nr:chemotaxis response regulator protein-glutamate methylesterase [Terriglobales bacterium]
MNDAPASPRLIRVLVADDSAFMRTALTRMIESDPALRVSDTAQNGNEALEKIRLGQPDVVTLDVEMPGLDGLATLRRIMEDFPRPVIMVSSLTQEGAEITLEALDIGAFDYVPKQLSYVSLDIIKIRDDLVAKIKAAAKVERRPVKKPVQGVTTPSVPVFSPVSVVPEIVVLGTSTGGPKALQQILPLLPTDLGVGVLIVQHMPPGFTAPFARRLNNLCKISVREATQGEPIAPGVVYIAPAGQHMVVSRRSPSSVAIQLSNLPDGMLHKPSVDVMMLSVADVFRDFSMGIIMTGMGADGLQGMRAIANAGGLTVGQDEPSCIVYGMPRSCAEAGVLRRVVPLNDIPAVILQATRYRKRA